MTDKDRFWHVQQQSERLSELCSDDVNLQEQPLRRDVRSLGQLLGIVIREQAGLKAYEAEEKLRQLAIRHREQEKKMIAEQCDSDLDEALLNEMTELIGDMDLEQTHQIVKAFAAFFELTNLAEANHRRRRNRAAQLSGKYEKAGLLVATLRRMKKIGISEQQALN